MNKEMDQDQQLTIGILNELHGDQQLQTLDILYSFNIQNSSPVPNLKSRKYRFGCHIAHFKDGIYCDQTVQAWILVVQIDEQIELKVFQKIFSNTKHKNHHLIIAVDKLSDKKKKVQMDKYEEQVRQQLKDFKNIQLHFSWVFINKRQNFKKLAQDIQIVISNLKKNSNFCDINMNQIIQNLILSYQLKDKQACKRLLLQGDIEEAANQCKKKDRQSFKKNLRNDINIKTFQEYGLKIKQEIEEVCKKISLVEEDDVEKFSTLVLEGNSDLFSLLEENKKQQVMENLKKSQFYSFFLSMKKVSFPILNLRNIESNIMKSSLLKSGSKINQRSETNQNRIDYQSISIGSVSIEGLLEKICKKYILNKNVISQCIQQLLDGKIDQAKLSVNKEQRDSFEKDLKSCSQFTQYLNSSKSFQIFQQQKLQAQARNSLRGICQKFNVNDIEDCLQQLLQQDFKNAKLNVKKENQQRFIDQCRKSKEFSKLIDYKQNLNQEDTILKAETSKFLKTYVADVQIHMLNFLEGNIDEILLNVKEKKKKSFMEDLEKSNILKSYIERKKPQIEVKSILKKYESSQQKVRYYLTLIFQCSFKKLFKCVPDRFDQIIKQIFQNQTVFHYFEDTKEASFNELPYIYFLLQKKLSLADRTLNLLFYGDNPQNEDGKWIKSYTSSPIQNQIKRLTIHEDMLSQFPKKIRVSFLNPVIRQIKQIVCLREIKHNEQQILRLPLDCKIKSYELRNKSYLQNILNSNISNNSSIKLENYSHETNQEIRKLIKQQLKIYQILQIQNLEQFLLKKIKSQDFDFDRLKQLFAKQKRVVNIFLKQGQPKEENYYKLKMQELNCGYYFILNDLYRDFFQQVIIPVNFGKVSFKIACQQVTTNREIYNQISQKQKINAQQIIIEIISREDDRFFINNDDSKLQKPLRIICYQVQKYRVQYCNKFKDIHLPQEAYSKSLKQIITLKLDQQISEQSFQIAIQIDSTNYIMSQKETLHQIFQGRNKQTLKSIKLIRKITIRVASQKCMLTYNKNSLTTIQQLKKLIELDSKIPFEHQTLLCIKSSGNQEQFEQVFNNNTIQQLSNLESQLLFRVFSKKQFDYYSFHQNCKLHMPQFKNAIISSKKDYQKLVELMNRNSQQAQIEFFYLLFNLLISSLKRKFPFKHVIENVRNYILEKMGQQIWSSNKFTDQFILYYILYNSQQKLRIKIINLAKHLYPIPLYFRNFSNINDIQNIWEKNKEIMWSMYQGMVITSIGLHSENAASEKGKTFLNNQIFYTKFQLHHKKHQIQQGCPQIQFNLLGNIIPISFIDIPSSSNQQMVKKIIQISDVIIVHSWKSHKQSEEYLKLLKQENKVKFLICFLRDGKNNNQMVSRVKKLSFKNDPFLEIPNLSTPDKSLSFIKLLKQKIWQVVKGCHNQTVDKNKYLKFQNNKIVEELEETCSSLNKEFLKMKKVSKKRELIQKIQRGLKNGKVQSIKKQAAQQGLHQVIPKVISILDKYREESSSILDRFKTKLSLIKADYQRKYYVIKEYKSTLENTDSQAQDKMKKIKDLQEKIRKLEFWGMNFQIQKNEKQMLEHLSKLFDCYENRIKTQFFSIQSLWREVQYLITFDQNYNINGQSLKQLYIRLQTNQLNENQPCEILNGDLLEIHKKTLKHVYKKMNKRPLIISVIGPQSSGKSTLLNFLFGSQFNTSEGRCTKGIYGTYFQIDKFRQFGCDGVFILDTEGLFAILNQKDKQLRQDFDSKLVLFCLLVSDIVIVNTKGNLDAQSIKILKSRFERYQQLAEQGAEWPSIFLVLNQNVSTNLISNQGDVNSLRQLFKTNSTYSLSQAFHLKEITHKELSILPQYQSFVKKQPRSQFEDQTKKLQNSIIECVKQKKQLKTLESKFQLFEKVWSTIEAFPDLGKAIPKEIRIELRRIQEWKLEKFNKLRKIKQQILTQLPENLQEKLVKQKRRLIENQIRQISDKEYIQNFLSKKKICEYLSDKIQKQKQTCQSYFKTVLQEFDNEVNEKKKEAYLDNCRKKGCEIELDQIKSILKRQQNNKKTFTDSQITEIFNNVFKKMLKELQASPLSAKQKCDYLKKMIQYYQCGNVQLDAQKAERQQKKLIIPTIQIDPESLELNFETFTERLSDKIFQTIGESANKYIQLRKANLSNLNIQNLDKYRKNKYFNFNQYYLQKTVMRTMYIGKQQLLQILKNSQKEGSKDFQNSFAEEKLKYYFQLINKTLLHFNIQLEFNSFKACYFYQSSYIWKKPPKRKLVFSYVDKAHQKIQAPPSSFLIYSNHFINIEQLNDILIDKKGMRYVQNISKWIQQSIQWSQIEDQINSELERIKKKQGYSNYLIAEVNKQLQDFGLKIYCQDFYQFIFGKGSFLKKKPEADIYQIENKKFQSEEVFKECVSRLKRFNQDEIFKNLNSVTDSEIKYNKNYLCLGRYQVKIYAMKEQYKHKSELQSLINGSYKEIIQQLSKDSSKQFIYNQLKKNNSFQKLIKQIRNHIQKAHIKIDFQSMQSICCKTLHLITQFNKQLSQVSHKLTFLSTGYFHLFTIYAAWKRYYDIYMQKALQPYFKLSEQKNKKFQNFKKYVSPKQRDQSSAQSSRFLSQMKAFVEKQIRNRKNTINNQLKQKYKNQMDRQKLQQIVDKKYLSEIIPKEKQLNAVEYIKSPSEILKKEEQNFINGFINTKLKIQYQQLEKQVSKIVQNLREGLLKICKQKNNNLNQSMILNNQLFQIETNYNFDDPAYKIQLNELVMEFFLNLLLNQSKHQYASADNKMKITLSQKNKFLRQHNFFQQNNFIERFATKMKGQSLFISNFYQFVENLSKQSLSFQIMDNNKLLQEDRKNFQQLVKLRICNERCPSCNRVCGYSGSHTEHGAIFGHQVRGILGNKMPDNSPSFQLCDQVNPTHIVSHGNKFLLWKEICQDSKTRNYWNMHSQKTVKYKLQQNQIKNGWDAYKDQICRQSKIENTVYRKAQIKKFSYFHYIFMLDSLQSDNWQKLKKKSADMLQKLTKIKESENKIRVSVLFQNQVKVDKKLARQVGSQINNQRQSFLYTLQFWTTNNQSLFQNSIKLVNKDIDTSPRITLMYISDGKGDYPQSQIQELSSIKQKYPSKLQFVGISIDKEEPTMKKMIQALKGSNQFELNH